MLKNAVGRQVAAVTVSRRSGGRFVMTVEVTGFSDVGL
jgi:hypothetical protein